MAHNYLEQLVAEWYEYRGYFVRRNVQVGKRRQGGYECELDVVAFHPGTRHLTQIEPSTDSNRWDEREARYRKKFDAGRKHIPALFRGMDVPDEIDQIAVFAGGSAGCRETLAGGRVVHVSEILWDIFTDLRDKHLMKRAVPENFPILRTLQLVATFRKEVLPALDPSTLGNEESAPLAGTIGELADR